MRETSFGGLRCRVAGGVDKGGGGNGPVVVLMHGYGAPGEDLVPLAFALDVPSNTRFVFPQAPLQLSHFDGRAWWLLDEERIERAMRGEIQDRTEEHPDGLESARGKVLALLEEVETRMGVSPEQIVLGGFSQGAMLTVDAALHYDKALAGLIVLSGTLIDSREWLPRMPSKAGTPVFQSHGTADALLPYSFAERLRDHLQDAGLPVEWHSFRGGHEIPEKVLSALGPFLTRALTTP